MYITLLQMAQFYTQQAYGLWPQVWPVSDTKVIKDMNNFIPINDWCWYYLYNTICYKTSYIVLLCFTFLYCRVVNNKKYH